MFTPRSLIHHAQRFAAAALLSAIAISAGLAAPVNILDRPLFLNDPQPPLNMLVLSRDHRLYYEAYNDASDLNGDGTLDIGYKGYLAADQGGIDYYGYFESDQCYTYNSTDGIFNRTSTAGTNKTCAGAQEWSGDWLNYVTTSRIDALRKVLYGGTRYIDTATDTVLQRAYIPQDAHSWGKEYTSVAVDGYDIRNYTPLDLPTGSGTRRHLFANTSVASEGNVATVPANNPALLNIPVPKLRYLENRTERIWNWLSIERPVAGGQIVTGLNGDGTESRSNVTPTDRIVRVRVCGTGSYSASSNCRVYASGSAKPTGLLQDYGESNTMYFGLLSGSYGLPHEGGVLRKAVASIAGELNLTNGTFIYNQNPPGIISTIDRLRITGYNRTSLEYNCGWVTTNADTAGTCSMWGNPTAEMMYETLRYFAGRNTSTSSFSSGAVSAEETELGLQAVTWNNNTNPYRPLASGGFPICARPFQTVISDASPSYDSDTIPGSYFGSAGDNLGSLNASTLGQTIWNQEIGGSGSYFIGQSAGTYDGAPTVKTVTSFGNIRGLSPEAPAKEGSYNAGSVAYFGHQNDLNAATGQQRMQTFSVALASPLPQIEIPVNGRTITLVPFAKSVSWPGNTPGINPAQGVYQPTNQIVDFYVDSLTPTSGRFRVNFEDVEQGADHDMDAIAVYEYEVNGNGTVTVRVTSEYAAGGIIQHLGYVISGTTQDGSYLVVRDRDTAAGNDVNYFLDTPNVAAALPLGPPDSTRTFTPGTSTAAGYLKDPLWYAAKWGGFNDVNNNNIPDLREEWASNAAEDDTDPDPDNYFLVTNALRLKAQLTQAFNDILDRSGSASSASVSSGSISSDTRIYQATFDARTWAGHLIAYPVGTGSGGTTEGELGTPVWDAAAAAVMPAPNTRRILTVQGATASATQTGGILRTGVPFRWASLDTTLQGELRIGGSPPVVNSVTTTVGQQRLDYLRGDRSREQPAGTLRRRTSVLGDIVNSAPVFVGAPPWRYPDGLETVPYSNFVNANLNRQKVVYVGANDGMLHAFNAVSGAELFAFVPRGVFRNLYRLTDPAYPHLYYADGAPSVVDAFWGTPGAWHTVLVAGLNKGGQSVYALDVTNPAAITEGTPGAVLWEFTDRQDADLGYTFSRPAVVKLENGQWAAIFGNGYNNTEADGAASATGNAALYIVNIADGSLIKKIQIPAVPAAQNPNAWPNGLATPAVIDSNGNGRADTAYAGDLFGNLWKFDLTSTTPVPADQNSGWRIAYTSGGVRVPLFVAVNGSNQRQPITERPQVGRGPNGVGWVVLFGTGKFLEPADRILANLRVQSFYGVFDAHTLTSSDVISATWRTGSPNPLLQQTILADLYSWVDGAGVTHTQPPVRVTSNNARLTTHRGWYIDLVSPLGFEGEMQVTNPVLRNGRVVFTTLIPDPDVCSYGGRGWLMDLDALSGSRLLYTPFDLNDDQQYNASDYVVVDGVPYPASGMGSDAILTAPAFLSGNVSDYAVTTSSGSDLDGRSIDINRSNAGPSGRGRQSWRQLR